MTIALKWFYILQFFKCNYSLHCIVSYIINLLFTHCPFYDVFSGINKCHTIKKEFKKQELSVKIYIYIIGHYLIPLFLLISVLSYFLCFSQLRKKIIFNFYLRNCTSCKHIYLYIKVAGCVSGGRRILLTAEPIWFSFTV